MNRLCKEQRKGIDQRETVSQAEFINEIFGVACSNLNETIAFVR